MIYLNLVFGIITVISFGYAIWQNRAAQSAKHLTESVTKNIQKLATELRAQTIGTPAEGYAHSIEKISGSLLADGRSEQPRIAGRFDVVFVPHQLRTLIGSLTETPTASLGAAIRGRLDGPAWTEQDIPHRRPSKEPREDSVLVFGPYKHLPIIGTYIVHFRLRAEVGSSWPGGPLVYADVYNHERHEYLAWKTWSGRELNAGWNAYSLEFFYPRSMTLEYRIALCHPGVWVECDGVKVEFQSNNAFYS